uniref:Decapping nuclease n=1 Tax=Rhabditophanes sp. KR3021 TaxID=114890 RepID=A0AC35TIX3_9BILA
MSVAYLARDFINPICIGEVSLKHDAGLCEDSKENKSILCKNQLYGPCLAYNLRLGFRDFEKRTEIFKRNARLNFILHASNNGKLPLREVFGGAQLYCSRGVLVDIALSCYLRNGVNAYCVRRQGIIFLFLDDEPEINFYHGDQYVLLESGEKVSRNDMNEYVGHKFETYVTRNIRDNAPDIHGPVRAWAQYRQIFKTNFKSRRNESRNINIAYSAEMDCFDITGESVELKTKIERSSNGVTPIFGEIKALKTWFQCVLSNSTKVIVGSRDQNDIIKKIESISTDRLLTSKIEMAANEAFEQLHSILFNVINSFNNYQKNITLLKFNKQPEDQGFKFDIYTMPNDQADKFFNDKFNKVFPAE